MVEKKKKYKAKYSGKLYNTKYDAMVDNRNYLLDPSYRFEVKAQNMPSYKDIEIPYIPEKAVTLTNAGLATGAHLSTNLLDTIAKYAELAGLPILTALGLATKESTLGNPTDDKTFSTLFAPGTSDREYFENLYNTYGTELHINNGNSVSSKELINMHDSPNPYYDALAEANRLADKGKDFNLVLLGGERYADNQAKRVTLSIADLNVLLAGFNKYKNNPSQYNPGLSNYQLLVEQRGKEVWQSPEIQLWWKVYNLLKKYHPDNEGTIVRFKANGGELDKPLEWNDLSMKDRAAYIRMGVANGYNDIDSIKEVYNEFREGGNLYHKGGKKQYVYNVLPSLLKKAGVDVRVTSGYRPNGAVGTAKFSHHSTNNAVDIVPTGNSTWDDIRNALYNDPEIKSYMLANGYGLLDETDPTIMKKTGATGAHFHIGKDSKPALAYRNRVGALLQTGDNKVVYFTNPFMPIPEDNPKVVASTTVPPLATPTITNILLPVEKQDNIAAQLTLPEIVVTPDEPRNRFFSFTPQDLMNQMLSTITPYEPIVLPKPTTASERLAQSSQETASFLLKDLEDSILRNTLLGNYDLDKLRRDLKDLLFYRNMNNIGAYGGNLFDGTSQPTQRMNIMAYHPEEDYWSGPASRFGITVTKKKHKGLLDHIFDIPTMVQASPGSATSYATTGQYMPRVESTIGKELGQAAATVAAPLIPSAALAVGTPGSAFWTNPITQQIMTGTAMSEGVNLANKAVTGYNTVGEGVGDVLEQATGWNPNNTWLGPLVTEAFNPGWYWSPNSVMGAVGKVGNAVEKGAEKFSTLYNSPTNVVYPSNDLKNLEEVINNLKPLKLEPDIYTQNRRLVDTAFNFDETSLDFINWRKELADKYGEKTATEIIGKLKLPYYKNMLFGNRGDDRVYNIDYNNPDLYKLVDSKGFPFILSIESVPGNMRHVPAIETVNGDYIPLVHSNDFVGKASERAGELLKASAYNDYISGRNPIMSIPEMGQEVKYYTFPDDIQEVLNEQVYPRMWELRKLLYPNFTKEDFYKKLDSELLGDWNVDENGNRMPAFTVFPLQVFDKTNRNFIGLFSPDTKQIAASADYSLMDVVPHEVRHKLQTLYKRTPKELELLTNSFGEEFLAASPAKGTGTQSTKDMYDMVVDEETTNLDARQQLLEIMHDGPIGSRPNLTLEEQNAIIDSAPDEEVINAMRFSNGYGKRFVKHLEETGKLTKERVLAWRESMKYVGAYAAPVGIGLGTAGTMYGTSNQ